MPKVFCPVTKVDDFKKDELQKFLDDEIVATCTVSHDCENKGNYNFCMSEKVCPHARFSRKENM